MGWKDNVDQGQGIIPIHVLNLVCAVHLRQEHGFKRWQISRFKEAYPWLIWEMASSPSRPSTTWRMSRRQPSRWMRAAPCD